MTDEGQHGAAVIPEAKQHQVAELAEKLGRMRSAVLSDYRGLSVAQLEELRASLRGAGIDYLVLKNTLARRAGEQAGLSELNPQLVGPTAIAISYEDVSAPARLLIEYARANRRLEMVRGGIAEGRVLSPAEVRQLADLPSRDVLIAQLIGVLEASASQLVGLLDAPGRDLVGLLDAQAQAGGGAAAA
ncbi:MAG TPA: 50S ribosomal protein L10 [Candidatus Dormibacteraeota bacterium]|nr:50S ribosomal protein L10 [Candidatus Dormibacteraeota bacterium]